MTAHARAAANPLSRVALSAPSWALTVASIGGRIAGAAIAVYVATSESYERTEVFAAAVAAIAIVTVLTRGRSGPVAGALAGGLTLFAGAALGKETPVAGLAMIASGAVAGLGAVAIGHRRGVNSIITVGAFFAALPLMVAGVAAMALIVEG